MSKILFYCLILIFISGYPVSMKTEACAVSECFSDSEESEESEESELKVTARSQKKILQSNLLKSGLFLRNKVNNFLTSLTSYLNFNTEKNIHSRNLSLINSTACICSFNLRYLSLCKCCYPLFVNISFLKQLTISQMRC